jgi:hypothetical protein
MGKDLAETLARRAAIDQMSRRPSMGMDERELAFRLFPDTL